MPNTLTAWAGERAAPRCGGVALPWPNRPPRRRRAALGRGERAVAHRRPRACARPRRRPPSAVRGGDPRARAGHWSRPGRAPRPAGGGRRRRGGGAPGLARLRRIRRGYYVVRTGSRKRPTQVSTSPSQRWHSCNSKPIFKGNLSHDDAIPITERGTPIITLI